MRIDPASLAPLTAGLYRLWVASLRFRSGEYAERMLAAHRRGERLLFALWHNELFSLTGFGVSKAVRMATMVSQSRDGEIIARVLDRLGHSTVRGSSTRGGVKALLGVKRLMEREGRIGVLTIDGPKGPRHEPKDGVFLLAHRAKARIVPLRAFPRRKWVFGSWDRFELPWPGTRVDVAIGEPYAIECEKLDRESLDAERRRLKAAMDALRP